MAALPADKQKRFRLHVVDEMYKTEKAYTSHLRFIVKHLLFKAREKGRVDQSFTEETISTLFGNIEDILDLHERLVEDLERCLPNGPVHSATIAQCYLKYGEEFAIYQRYGEKNLQAQQMLYGLEEQQTFKAFFAAAMLLGGQEVDEVSAYLFKPIQRICKYPLLFRKLEKYTPEDHPDREATVQALAMMKEVVSLINEAKRRVEKLERIADIQANIDDWEGPNAIDTCNELIKEGLIIKISAGNTQERMFYLFDNLLVYCKKPLMGHTLHFRGRIPVENLEIENMGDGTADFLTNGIRVENAWKVRNSAKHKWFVLVAKTPEEKAGWMEAMRKEREKSRRKAATRAQHTRDLILEKSEKLYTRAKKDPPLMRDHRARFKTYSKCFTGAEMVQWLIDSGEASNSEQAVILGQALLENGIIHHVNDRHHFKKSGDLLYRFRHDDGTYRGNFDSTALVTRGIRIYCRLHGLFDPLIREQRVGIRGPMKCVVNAQKLLDWLLSEGDIQRREEGVALGQEFFATGIIRHAADERNFRDGAHYYRFTADDGHEGGKEKSGAFGFRSVTSCLTLTVPFSEQDGHYGVKISSGASPVVESCSPSAQMCGVCPGQSVIAINGLYLDQTSPELHILAQLAPPNENPPPLSLLVAKKGSVYVTLAPVGTGLGFHIKGSNPVVIHKIDQGSSAAGAGILPGCCILKVGDQDALKLSHDMVVQAVKDTLAATTEDGSVKVNLKLSFGHLEQVATYQYSTSDEMQVKVFDRTVESPYCFELPAKVLSLYANEAEELVSHLSASGVTETRVSDYCTELNTLVTVYKRVKNFLSAPRWPSYRPFGSPTTAVLSACPVNLHTSLLDVVTSNSCLKQPPTPVDGEPVDEGDQSPPQVYTRYPISSMGIPTVQNKTNAKESEDSLGHALTRRELIRNLHKLINELEMDNDLADRLVCEMNQTSPTSPLDQRRDSMDTSCTRNPFLTIPGLYKHMDFSPVSSPIPRHRMLSMGSPLPVVKLLVDSLLSKVASLKQLLENKLLTSILEEADPFMSVTGKELVSQFLKQLDEDCRRMKVATVSHTPGEALSATASELIATAEEYAKSISTRLEISLALCDKVDLLQVQDRMFCQLLTALATAFAHQLMAAAQGRLNMGVEYKPCNEDASQKWLMLITSKGLLVHLQSTMAVHQASELSALKSLHLTAKQLSSVVLHVVEQSEDEPHGKYDLPMVSVAGDRSELHVTFALAPTLFQNLPDSLTTSLGVKVCPVLFNKGFMDIDEGCEEYLWEKELNDSSLMALKDYYRSLRAFNFDRSFLPDDTNARKQVLSVVSQPLNAMDVLVGQLEVAIRSPMRSGVGLLTIAAELLGRMGAVRINICESGVFRSGMATSLEQVITLARSHGLPARSLRTAVNALRLTGSFHYIARKNKADISVSLPKQPPKLYQLPPQAS